MKVVFISCSFGVLCAPYRTFSILGKVFAVIGLLIHFLFQHLWELLRYICLVTWLLSHQTRALFWVFLIFSLAFCQYMLFPSICLLSHVFFSPLVMFQDIKWTQKSTAFACTNNALAEKEFVRNLDWHTWNSCFFHGNQPWGLGTLYGTEKREVELKYS